MKLIELYQINARTHDAEESKYSEQGIGEVKYEEKGPYHCNDCIHLDGGCWHPKVMVEPKLADRKLKDGSIKVEAEKGCCKFVNQ